MSAPRPYPDRRGIDPDVRIPILPGFYREPSLDFPVGWNSPLDLSDSPILSLSLRDLMSPISPLY
jgi:hypothetical protein